MLLLLRLGLKELAPEPEPTLLLLGGSGGDCFVDVIDEVTSDEPAGLVVGVVAVVSCGCGGGGAGAGISDAAAAGRIELLYG